MLQYINVISGSELLSYLGYLHFVPLLVSTAYTEVTNFLQGYVDNEANLNEDGSCAATCLDYVVTRHYNCVSGSLCDSSENRHESAKCDGVIRNCDAIDNADLTICEIVRIKITMQSILDDNFLLIFYREKKIVDTTP